MICTGTMPFSAPSIFIEGETETANASAKRHGIMKQDAHSASCTHKYEL